MRQTNSEGSRWDIGVEYAQPKELGDAEQAVVTLTQRILSDNTSGLEVEDMLYTEAKGKISQMPNVDPGLVAKLNAAFARKQAEFAQEQSEDAVKVKRPPSMQASYDKETGLYTVRISGLDPDEADAYKDQLNQEQNTRSLEELRDRRKEKGLLEGLDGLLSLKDGGANLNAMEGMLGSVFKTLKRDLGKLTDELDKDEKEKNKEKDLAAETKEVGEGLGLKIEGILEGTDVAEHGKSAAVARVASAEPMKGMPGMGVHLDFVRSSNQPAQSEDRQITPAAAVEEVKERPGVGRGDMPRMPEVAAEGFTVELEKLRVTKGDLESGAKQDQQVAAAIGARGPAPAMGV